MKNIGEFKKFAVSENDLKSIKGGLPNIALLACQAIDSAYNYNMMMENDSQAMALAPARASCQQMGLIE